MLFGRPSPYFRMRVARAERMCTPSPTLAHLHAHISMKPWPPPILLTCFHISVRVPSQRNMSDESIRSGSTCAFDAVERMCTPPTLAHLHAHISMKPWPPPILLTCFHISDHVPSQRNMSHESIRNGSTCAFDAVERMCTYHHRRSLSQAYLDEALASPHTSYLLSYQRSCTKPTQHVL